MNTMINSPRHLAWSTDTLNLADPFQRRWYIQQILVHGSAEDIHRLIFDEVAQEIDHLMLPADIESLWKTFLESRLA